MNRYFLLIICAQILLISCSVKNNNIIYDKELKNFNFDRPAKKISLGLLTFTDGRSDFDRLGEDLTPQRKSIRVYATKIAEEILTKHGGFSSVIIIQPFELPDFNNQAELNRFLKNRDVDYIFAGEILEAKVIKIESRTSATKKVRNVLNYGAVGENFEYMGRSRVRGKLFSIQEKKVIWEGQGISNFKPNSRYATFETNLTGALYNAIGSMLKNMSSVFGLKIKEVQ